MERDISKQASMFMWTLVVGLISQNLVIPVMSTASFEDQKNYYSPDPGSTPPTGSHGTPSHGGSPSHGTPPSHGGSPSHGTPSHGTPSHGGGYSGSPPANCGTPPTGHHYPTPAPPTGGGGGYYNPPSTPTPVVTPPTYVTPPTPIIDPGTPTTPSIPTPPFDPNSPPFSGTCNYWSSHPGLIWGLFGWWGTLGSAFGTTTLPGFGATMSLPQALSNTHTDGFGALYREGTASLLNSMVNRRFPFTTPQVRDSFAAALSSNKAAAAQAHVFKLANEGRLKPRF